MAIDDPSDGERTRLTVLGIIDTLGCTVDALHSGYGLPRNPTDTAELLGLWLTFASDERRARILAQMRGAVAAQGGKAVATNET